MLFSNTWKHRFFSPITLLAAVLAVGTAVWVSEARFVIAQSAPVDTAADDATKMLNDGRQIFRFDTFGDEVFWGDTLKLHQAIQGSALGGVGSGLSPKAALSLGLKVDASVVPADLATQIKSGQLSLLDPANTVALIKLNAVVGITGFFDSSGGLMSIGIQCALCHSTVDNSFLPGIGKRLDGWPNRDLDPGKIIALAPNLRPLAELLTVDQDTVRTVLRSWGPGKYDAELVLDGKAVNDEGNPAAVLIPPAFGLAGVNLATWTGWGHVSHWNAFVANIEMHGVGRFFDSRLNDSRFPIAIRGGLGDIKVDPAKDRITKQLPALHFYQMALRAPKAVDGSFDKPAAARGQLVFDGKGQCNNCHVRPLFTEPGWNMHTPQELCVDSFQANRSPDKHYRTAPLAGLFAHQTGGYYHDGRFATLDSVLDHYDRCKGLGLTSQEKKDLIQYLLSI
jgi:hypothetical protein